MRKWRSIEIPLAALLLLTSLITLPGSGPAAADEPKRQPGLAVDRPDQPKVVELTHVVTVRDALAALEDQPSLNALEVKFSGNGVVGGLLLSRSESFEQQAEWAEASFRHRFQRDPVVSKIVLSPTTSEIEADQLKTTLSHRQVPEINENPVRLQFSGGSTHVGPLQQVPQDIPEHFPSIWYGNTYQAVRGDTLREAYENLFWYESFTGADPTTFPSDWGMEIGITAYNDSLISSNRPVCPGGGDSDWDFWSGTYETGGLWGTNVPESSFPYADYLIIGDSCQVNSVEVGIGFPRQLAQDTVYIVFTELYPGTQVSSPASAAVTMKSNDCNNVWADPSTGCMGLNANREPPAGFSGAQNYVKKDRNWSVPGCAIMADGWDGPLLIPSGAEECPASVIIE